MKRKRCRGHGDVKCICGGFCHQCGCINPPWSLVTPCIHKGSADDLLNELVTNAAKEHIEEDPTRFAWAVMRIAEEKRTGLNVIMLEIQHRVAEETGSERLPGETLTWQQIINRYTGYASNNRLWVPGN